MEANNERTGANESMPKNENPSESQTNEKPEAQEQYSETKESAENDGGAENNKTFAILGYIFPFLFFLPLMNEKSKNNPYARFHANQQLILLGATVGLYLLHNVLYFALFSDSFFLMKFINFAFLVFVVIGIVHASKGEMKELPLIGGFSILK